MAVQSFVKGDDLKKLIEDKIISTKSVKQVLKKKGILPVCISAQSLSDIIYDHFLGSSTMTQMQEVLKFEQNNLKSTVAVISPCQQNDEEDFLTNLADELSFRSRLGGPKYLLKNVQKHIGKKEGKKAPSAVTLQYVYEKQQKGRIKLVDTKTVTLDVVITPIIEQPDKYKVSIRHEGMSESKKFISLLEEMTQHPEDEGLFDLKRITLSRLTREHKVDFFDNFASQTHKDWLLTDVVNVTVNKDESTIDDEEETAESEVEISEPTGQLSGISSAILKGDRLRRNDFVEECMRQGFIFSSMSYKFEHKTDPNIIVIDVSFKQKDLKISILKTYELDEDDHPKLEQMSAEDQVKIIDYFQNVAYRVYADLIEQQRVQAEQQALKVANT